MKKIIFIISLIGITLTSWSQDRMHELKLDALGVLAGPSLELTYEYALNVHSAIGVSTFIRLDRPNRRKYEGFTLAPFYRQYFYDNSSFGNKGFFIEALIQYTNGVGEKDVDNEEVDYILADYGDIGIGFGGGVKWISPNGFTVEGVAGVGRNFKIDEHSNDFFLRFGINLGYRFY